MQVDEEDEKKGLPKQVELVRGDREPIKVSPDTMSETIRKRWREQEAKEEGQALIEKARLEIQRERDEAIDELRQEFTDLTIEAAGRVIERSLDKEAHRELIDKVLDESSILKKD